MSLAKASPSAADWLRVTVTPPNAASAACDTCWRRKLAVSALAMLWAAAPMRIEAALTPDMAMAETEPMMDDLQTTLATTAPSVLQFLETKRPVMDNQKIKQTLEQLHAE